MDVFLFLLTLTTITLLIDRSDCHKLAQPTEAM